MTAIDHTYTEALIDHNVRLVAGIRSRMLTAYLSCRALRRRARLTAANEPGTRRYLQGRADGYHDVAQALYFLRWPGRAR